MTAIFVFKMVIGKRIYVCVRQQATTHTKIDIAKMRMLRLMFDV